MGLSDEIVLSTQGGNESDGEPPTEPPLQAACVCSGHSKGDEGGPGGPACDTIYNKKAYCICPDGQTSDSEVGQEWSHLACEEAPATTNRRLSQARQTQDTSGTRRRSGAQDTDA